MRSRSAGVNAQGAAVTTLPGYKLWVDDVNKKGGILVKEFNKRIPIEVTEYDDTSNAETAVRLVERLMTQDKVDFVLPPWSTGFNLATAPVYRAQRLSATRGDRQLQRRAPISSSRCRRCSSSSTSRAISASRSARCSSKLKSENKINNKIVMLSVADQFGAELTSGVTPVLQQAGFEFVVAQELSARLRRSHQRDQGGEGFGGGQLHRLQLSSRYLHADQHRGDAELQSEDLPRRG